MSIAYCTLYLAQQIANGYRITLFILLIIFKNEVLLLDSSMKGLTEEWHLPVLLMKNCKYPILHTALVSIEYQGSSSHYQRVCPASYYTILIQTYKRF